ncbi:MAG: aminotransferase class I/II-fold pyridoxal phosphate-dependent enzyme, partial [Bacillota bacterium]
MKIPDYARRLESIKNDELSQLMDLISRDDIISFAGGIPDEALFPVEKLQDLIGDMMAEEGANIFQYGSTEGFQVLKEYIVEFMGNRGIVTDPERLLITSGSQQGLDLMCKLFVDEGDRVVVADPSYLGGIGAIK